MSASNMRQSRINLGSLALIQKKIKIERKKKKKIKKTKLNYAIAPVDHIITDIIKMSAISVMN